MKTGKKFIFIGQSSETGLRRNFPTQECELIIEKNSANAKYFFGKFNFHNIKKKLLISLNILF